MALARALRQLDGSSLSFLTDLTVSALPYPELMEILLDARPNITSLQVEIQIMTCSPHFSPRRYWATQPDTSGAVKLLSISNPAVTQTVSHLFKCKALFPTRNFWLGFEAQQSQCKSVFNDLYFP